jgi:arginine-tRNA-protein transferase
MNDSRPALGGARLSLYLSATHACSYLPGLSARTLFVDPMAPMDGPRYEGLIEQGFRRSGAHVYRPACDPCRRCVPVRIPVREFSPNRSQRRNARLNADLTLVDRPAAFDPEHYFLYETYVRSRHAGGGMAEDASAQSYQDFLTRPWGGETRLLELRLGARLLAVAVTDRLPASLSAVYTFFDPAPPRRALGTFAVLRQIALARRLGLRYLYLGYWIEECRKMSYKDAFRPIQAWTGGHWRQYGRGETIAWRGSPGDSQPGRQRDL